MGYSVPKYLSNSQYGYKAPAPAPRYQLPEYVTSQAPHRQYTLGQKISRFIHNPVGIYKASAAEPGGWLGPARQDQAAVNNPSVPGTWTPGAPTTQGSGDGYDQTMLSLQQAQLARQMEDLKFARGQYNDRSSRYNQFFELQKAEAERQAALAQEDISTARKTYGENATAQRGTLNQQATGNEANINAMTNAAGTFDSSARLSDINQNNQILQTALSTLGKDEQAYYGQLDRQLQELQANLKMQRAQIGLNESDTKADIEAKLRSFDAAEKDLQDQQTSLRAQIMQKSQARQQTQAGAFTNYFQELNNIANFGQALSQSQLQKLIDQHSQQYFGESQTGNYYYNRLRIMNDKDLSAQERQKRLDELDRAAGVR